MRERNERVGADTRFEGLDRLKGIALWAMLLHHLVGWTVGDARRLLGGEGGMAATDLAAPAFTVAAGAGAALLARRLRARDGDGTTKMLRRWALIGAWGVVLGALVDHQVDSIGVLETLAVVGVTVTLLARWLVPGAVAWAGVAAVLTFTSTGVVDAAAAAGGWWRIVFGFRFPWLSYLAMAAAGAAMVSFLGDRERRGRLVAVAGGGVLLVAVLAVLGAGIWPADRYPSGPAFIVPGVVATVAVWAGLALLGDNVVTRGMARAGRRTLLVYVAHYGLRVALDLGGWWQELAGAGWTVAAIATAAGIAVVSALPWRRSRPQDSGQVAEEAGDPAELAVVA